MAYKGRTKLGDFFSSRRDKGLPRLPTLSVTLNRGLVERDSLDRKTETNLEDNEHLLVRKGDIPYNMMRMWQGASGLAEKDGLLSPAYVVLAPKRDVDSLYASYLFKSSRLIYLFWAYSYGLTNDRLRLYFNDFKKIPVNIPSLPEQKKIALILSTWDKAIELTEKLLGESRQQKKSLMQQILTGKKRLRGFSGEWISSSIEELENEGLIKLSRGKVISKKDITNNPGDYPIYSSSVKNAGLFGRYGEFMFDEELITWSVDGGGHFFYRRKHKFSVTNVSGCMRLDTSHLSYLFIASQLELLHSKLTFDYQTKAHPSVIRKLYKIAVPSIGEQRKIETVISSAEHNIETLQQKLDCLKQEKKALMQQLLTGKRRVKVDEA